MASTKTKSSRGLHLSLIIFLVCLLFTITAWDHYFNSALQFDRRFVSNLILLMGTLFSLSAGFLVWSLEKQNVAAHARAEEAYKLHKETEEACQKLEDTQDRLIQAEKLASIGRIVAGVAHELKNPLITINGYANLLLERPIDAENRHFVDIINHQAKRCHQTVQDLLTFSHTKALRLQPVQADLLLGQILAEMPPEFARAGIEIVKKFPPEIPVIQADAAQLVRVFSNLLTNAWHAMEEVSHDRRLILSILVVESGLQIFLTDNGQGIEKADLDKIFDPFFTTKPAGKGTGLGLSLCFGIIREHGGKITAQSEKGKGTTFVVELPWTPESYKTPEKNLSARKKILVADDEPAILDFVCQLLGSWGYEAMQASNGPEALEKAWMEHENIRLAVLDINMPGKDGFEVAEQFRDDQRLSAIPIILLTGREADEDLIRAGHLQIRKILHKPLQYQELQATIAEVLKGPAF